MQTLPGWKAEIMQARVTINGEIIMGSDAPPGNAYWIYEVVFTLKRE
jgi:uncharacterized glyoxalase superfamily protein PhnB